MIMILSENMLRVHQKKTLPSSFWQCFIFNPFRLKFIPFLISPGLLVSSKVRVYYHLAYSSFIYIIDPRFLFLSNFCNRADPTPSFCRCLHMTSVEQSQSISEDELLIRYCERGRGYAHAKSILIMIYCVGLSRRRERIDQTASL